MGPIRRLRTLEPTLNGQYLLLMAKWQFGAEPQEYEELCLIGEGNGGLVCFLSFTSDGKRSQGTLADATHLHPRAVGFEADMPAGHTRMVYWPEEAGFRWVAELKSETGWDWFVDHRYRAVEV